MNDAADFAFRQAWAICPYSPETVIRYVNLLISQNRRSDALLVAETAAKMPEMKGNEQLRAFRDCIGKSQHQGAIILASLPKHTDAGGRFSRTFPEARRKHDCPAAGLAKS